MESLADREPALFQRFENQNTELQVFRDRLAAPGLMPHEQERLKFHLQRMEAALRRTNKLLFPP